MPLHRFSHANIQAPLARLAAPPRVRGLINSPGPDILPQPCWMPLSMSAAS